MPFKFHTNSIFSNSHLENNRKINVYFAILQYKQHKSDPHMPHPLIVFSLQNERVLMFMGTIQLQRNRNWYLKSIAYYSPAMRGRFVSI